MALFGLKYYGELRSKHQGIIWRVEIAQRGYVGDCEEMTFCGSDPIKVTWEKRGDGKNYHRALKVFCISILVAKTSFSLSAASYRQDKSTY